MGDSCLRNYGGPQGELETELSSSMGCSLVPSGLGHPDEPRGCGDLGQQGQESRGGREKGLTLRERVRGLLPAKATSPCLIGIN